MVRMKKEIVLDLKIWTTKNTCNRFQEYITQITL